MPARIMNQLTVRESWRLRETDKPLRADAYSQDHLAEYARELASILNSSIPTRKDDGLLHRFAENAKFLRDCIQIIPADLRDGLTLRTDAEWLLDNFYIVEEQLRDIHDNLPRRYFRELPKSASGEPRIYSLAVELVTHTDSVLDEETIVRFVGEFQTVSQLSMGEIWAIPIMFRLVLTENLRRIAAQMLSGHASERKAAQIVGEWSEGSEFPVELSPIHESGCLIFHVIEKLQEDSLANMERLKDLERKLSAFDLTIQQSVHLEHQRQASSQVSIGNVITSMRLISSVDWVAFFERTNLSEQILRRDPAGIYSRMDLESRDRYRHVVEDLADGCHLSETEVAQTVIEVAISAPVNSPSSKHIGYWLIGDGRRALEEKINFCPKLHSRPIRWMLRHPDLAYFGAMIFVTLAAITVGAYFVERAGTSFGSVLILLGLALLPVSDFSVGLVNTLVTCWIRPRLLPKFDFKHSIPPDQRTVVVVPCMLSNPAEVTQLLQRLEMHFVANTDPALSFALLTDFPDAVQQQMPTDATLILQARSGIRQLNTKYANDDVGPFFLFHRERRWNQQENVWMGWERKRGKLMEFNQLLRGRTDTSYVVQEGQISRLISVNENAFIRYVITLDSDTTLPHDAARRLIATISHPLNAPVYDIDSRRVTAGYVLLQPRVVVNLDSAEKSHFSQIFANNPGLDPYSSSASDVYQDLFGEGSFTGKGIYEIDAFEQALEEAFPDNQILSHDLIEGCHTRVALVSDIELYDNFPPRYEADAKRQHRWVRGDWQISPWLLPIVPWACGWRPNRLSLLSRWKIFDNLRRSLVAPSMMAFLITGWLAFPQLAWWFTATVLLVQFFPALAQLGLTIQGWSRSVSTVDQMKVAWKNLVRSGMQSILMTALLPNKAWSMIDAIVRTTTRMLLTRKKLLEWATASDVERQLAMKTGSTLSQWCMVPALTIVLTVLMDPMARVSAIPFLAAWFFAPVLLSWLDQPPRTQNTAPINAVERQQMRLEARRIWAFFEAYVGPLDHWLPPDNVQEYPQEKIAHRISPTNEGLFLVSGLVAREFGFVSLTTLVDLWDRNFSQWKQFERYQGHFLNWYDTVTLQPLVPKYVSTVDSGNFVGCLLTLQKGIEDLRHSPIVGSFLEEGVMDTVEMITQTGTRERLSEDPLTQASWHRVVESLNRLKSSNFQIAESSRQLQSTLEQWQSLRFELSSNIDLLATSLRGSQTALLSQARILLELMAAIDHELAALFPWLPLIQEGITEEQLADGSIVFHFIWLPPNDAADICCRSLVKQLIKANTLIEIEQFSQQAIPALTELRDLVSQASVDEQVRHQATNWIEKVAQAILAGAKTAESLDSRLQSLLTQADELVESTDFRILFDQQRKLFSIGLNLETGRLDGSHYDLLCSEARLASFIAIAKGDVESRHWFHLGRQMTQAAGKTSLLSWGGTMFEYLMPPLFQKTYENSILMQSCRAAVERQQEYGRQRGVPWGISECAFGSLAANSDYHYRSFGVPGLGLKRGLSKDLVISPYSTMLALEFDPHGAIKNLSRIQKDGGLGDWGYYESLDYTPERVPAGKRSIVVRSYMAHHQGMSLVAIGNFLNAGSMRRRFHDNAIVKASELLLQERIPATTPQFEPHSDEHVFVSEPQSENDMVSRRITGVATAAPRIQLLSNGHYHVMLSSTGGGYSQHNAIGVTRWRADATRDHWGQFIYLRDVQSSRVWSATYQPTCTEPSRYETIYSIDKAEFFRCDGQFETQLEIAVSPENNAEVRQLTITNNGYGTREIEITSYAEVPLIEMAADISHSAFQKLFIETEYVSEKAALLAKRRPRDSQQPAMWAVHSLSAGAEVISTIQYETSRQVFLGRGRTPQNPAALEHGTPLSGTAGAVLDPIFSLRCRVAVPQDESVTIAFITSVAASRDEALALADQYHDPRGVQRAFELAWAYSQVELRHVHLSPTKMHQYQRLASAMLYPDHSRRPAPNRLKENHLGQSALWRYGISGTLPLFVVTVVNPEQINLVRESIGAHLYWKGRGLRTELVILNDSPGSYLDAMQDQLVELLQELQIHLDERPASVFLLRGAQIPADDKSLLDAVASVTLSGDRGSFARQVEAGTAVSTAPRKSPGDSHVFDTAVSRVLPSMPINGELSSVGTIDRRTASASQQFQIMAIEDLEFWNGFGGFARDGREYHIRLGQRQTTPMPWSNIMANPRFGCLVTESGGGYTWYGNSRENKLTTWANDPVSDTPGEMLYIRDLDSGELSSPFAGSCRDNSDYWIQYGQGYARFIHRSIGLSQQVMISIAPDDPVKFIVLTLRNELSQHRRLSLTYFVEWVLGVCREETQMHVVTSVDEKTGALLATNSYQSETSGEVSFLHVLHGERSLTGDRAEFIGRNGNLTRPAAIISDRLSGHTGAGFDPCGAMQASVRLMPREQIDVVFLLGAADSLSEVSSLLAQFGNLEAVRTACGKTIAQWNQTVSAIEVSTPDRAFDLIVNRWMIYQTLSCRLWGRSAYYQSGGAFGFRDQLQDVMALVYSQPALAREQILNAASRQFIEGDVQHWWHPPQGRGTRTRFSDDLVWLPFVVCHYIAVTDDESILDQHVPFLQSPPLDEGQQERYECPAVSTEQASLYEHCQRALTRSFRLGIHGLPLMGCGDWNDGMNKIGEEGRGESIWVGWFLLVVLERFIPLMERRNDNSQASEWENRSAELRKSLEATAWDGEWYRRAYFDDGTPLGSKENDECQIDSMTQTWAVIAGADPHRSRIAVESVMKRLVKWKSELVLLFSPPFDKSSLDPGYIKGYLPGIRENGGQYTHPTAWLIQALTALNDGDRAMQIFDLVNPINHATSPDAVQRYQVEPFVIAADVYGVSPHVGRGGWTWYTGSAAWLYRAAIEFILGFQLRGNTVRFNPQIPATWNEFRFRFRRGAETWCFRIVRADGSLDDSSTEKTLVIVKAGDIIRLDDVQNEIMVIIPADPRQPSPAASPPQMSSRDNRSVHGVETTDQYHETRKSQRVH